MYGKSSLIRKPGVNYLLISSNMTTGCGIAVLVDKDGKPIVTPIDAENQ